MSFFRVFALFQYKIDFFEGLNIIQKFWDPKIRIPRDFLRKITSKNTPKALEKTVLGAKNVIFSSFSHFFRIKSTFLRG